MLQQQNYKGRVRKVIGSSAQFLLGLNGELNRFLVGASICATPRLIPVKAEEDAVIEITGSNFSTTTTENEVYFGTIKAEVTEATANK